MDTAWMFPKMLLSIFYHKLSLIMLIGPLGVSKTIFIDFIMCQVEHGDRLSITSIQIGNFYGELGAGAGVQIVPQWNELIAKRVF